jgi:hypothetical protein
MRDVLWALRPVLLDRGLIAPSKDPAEGQKVGIGGTQKGGVVLCMALIGTLWHRSPFFVI